METTEKIVEAYVRYVRRWATIPNIKCQGQFEIDLLAIDPIGLKRYHIESGVSVSGLRERTRAPCSAQIQALRLVSSGFGTHDKDVEPSVVRLQ